MYIQQGMQATASLIVMIELYYLGEMYLDVL